MVSTKTDTNKYINKLIDSKMLEIEIKTDSSNKEKENTLTQNQENEIKEKLSNFKSDRNMPEFEFSNFVINRVMLENFKKSK
jgi:hypothetical protein